MKKNILLLFFLGQACSPKINQIKFIGEKTYESRSGPLYRGSKFIFNSDSTFVFVGQGPATFLSIGKWGFTSQHNEIVLRSGQSEKRFANPKNVDTLWVDFANSIIKMKSKKEIIFEGIVYYEK